MSIARGVLRYWIELSGWFASMILFLHLSGASIVWWQPAVLMTIFVALFLITKGYGYNALALPLISFLVLVGWLFLARIDPSLATGQFYGVLVASIAYLLGLLLPLWTKGYPRLWALTSLSLLLSATLFGSSVRGAKTWLVLPQFRFQPVEFARIFLVLYLGYQLGQERSKRELYFVLGVFFLLLAWQRDLGPALLILFVVCWLTLTQRFSWSKIAFYLVFVAVGLALAYKFFPHLQTRIVAWLWPWDYVDSKGYQVLQGLFALRAGGLVGQGLGGGLAQVIPEVHTDYLFSLIGEELGILGTFSILIAYLGLAFWAFHMLASVEDLNKRILGLGLTLLCHLQVFLVVGGILRLWPFTGMTLPFVSYGSNSLVAQFLSLGVVASLRREER